MIKVVTLEGSENAVAALETVFSFINHLIAQKESRLVTIAVDGMGKANIAITDEAGNKIGGGKFSIPCEPMPEEGCKAYPLGEIDGSGNIVIDIR